ncbi:Uncharacterised protein [Mycobacteroides abscessus subsp. abscessus]|nr:Uncharacterised protein [Mycobacteroides abscessus subsp. abscessus]
MQKDVVSIGDNIFFYAWTLFVLEALFILKF